METQDSSTKYWDEMDLMKFVMEHTPAIIQVVPDGRKEPISLQRQVDPLMGLSMVKITFKQRDAMAPTMSIRNPRGEALDPMAIDTTVSETVSCYQQVPPVELKMQKIREAAAKVFGPRPERIVSTTQVRESLRFDPSNSKDPVPHEEA